jgi:hypothetical protein
MRDYHEETDTRRARADEFMSVQLSGSSVHAGVRREAILLDG